MPYVPSDGVRLYYEEAGEGHPLVFVHEFGADLREWEAQMRHFSRDYRCIAYNARGYIPSDVPQDDAAYDYRRFADDVAAVIRGVGAERAHVVGLSMGAYAALMFGLRHPGLASALVVAGCGSGSERATQADFRRHAEAMAERFLSEGAPAAAQETGQGGTRVQLLFKDPRGWQDFVRHLAEHSAEGSARTLRNYQAGRPSLYDFEAELRALAVPVLLAVGDEDEPCLDVNLFLKRTLPSAGLWMAPRTGHAINLEEPAAFNAAVAQFLAQVERGTWRPRDPRTLAPGLSNPGKPNPGAGPTT
jgi:pimeloyl-ACP methyl ester carboxylesterase